MSEVISQVSENDLARAVQNEWLVTRLLCKKSFKDFVLAFWDEVPGTQPLAWGWHIDLICEELQKIAERVFLNKPKEYDLIINISPGTSKSSLASILFPAWIWTRMAYARVLSASHAEDLTLDLANKSRSVITSEKYQKLFPEIKLRSDQASKGYYINTFGGDRKTATASGKSPIGFHGHFLLLDDLQDPKGVLSEAETKSATEFITSVIPTRKVDKEVSVTILIMQRLGIQDCTAVMLKEAKKDGASKIRHLCLPAELEKLEDGTYSDEFVEPKELAASYVDGLMDPHRLSRNALRPYKAGGELFYATQFLQKPYAPSGGMFKEKYFENRRKVAPYNCRRVRYWDRASTPARGGYPSVEGCNTAGVLLAMDSDGKVYIEHAEVGQWEPGERNQVMRAVALRDRYKYGPKYEPQIWVEAEGGSSGRDAWLGVVRHLHGFNVREQQVSRLGKKEVRAEPWSAQLAAGNVWVVDNDEQYGYGKADWDIQEYVREHCVVGGTKIITDRGLKRIERIKEGDMVLTHMGRFRKVEKIESREVGSVRCIVSKGLEPLKITSDHAIWTMEMSTSGSFDGVSMVGNRVVWKKAGEIQSRDYVLTKRGQWEPMNGGCDGMTIPILTPDFNATEIDLRYFYSRLPDGNGRYHFIDDGKTIKMSDSRSQALIYKQPLDYEFGRFCGLYLAEGSLCIDMSFNKNEDYLLDESREFIVKRFGIRAHSWKDEKTNRAGVRSCLNRIKSFFLTFGKKASRKRIPWWAWMAPEEFHKGLVDGWVDGDGCLDISSNVLNATTVSLHLAWGMRIIASRLGYWPSMTVTDDRGTLIKIGTKITGKSNYKAYCLSMQKRKYTVARRCEDALGLYVIENKEEKGDVKVWNLQVAEDNSYTTTGGCVHNCAFPYAKRKDRVDASSGAFSILALSAQLGTIRVYHLNKRKDKLPIRLVVCDKEKLESLIIEQPSILVSIREPLPSGNDTPVNHSMAGILEQTILHFSDIDPKEIQEKWLEPHNEYGQVPQDLIMTREVGKRMWSMITKKRIGKVPEVLVVSDEGGKDRRAMSMAYGIADMMRLPRSSICEIGKDDVLDREDYDGGKRHETDNIPNRYVYDLTKISKNLVV